MSVSSRWHVGATSSAAAMEFQPEFGENSSPRNSLDSQSSSRLHASLTGHNASVTLLSLLAMIFLP